ncbi:MAG: hypothetical protein WDN76_07325 [Alphaproteobacteria bacterium]
MALKASDVAVVDGSLTRSLGRQLRTAFRDLGIIAEVRGPAWFFRKRPNGKTRIEQGFPAWILCWGHAIDKNPAVIDYSNVAKDNEPNLGWRPNAPPIICKTLAVETAISLSSLKTCSVEDWFLGKNRAAASAALRALVELISTTVKSPETLDYFDALSTEQDDKRIEAITAFYFKHRALTSDRIPDNYVLHGENVFEARQERAKPKKRKIANLSPKTAKQRAVKAAEERCQRLSATKYPPLIGHPYAKDLFDALVASAQDGASGIKLRDLGLPASVSDQEESLVDLGLAINELASAAKVVPPPLLALLYDQSQFNRPLGRCLRRYAYLTDSDYRTRENRLANKQDSVETVRAALQDRISKYIPFCTNFATQQPMVGNEAAAIVALRGKLFSPLPGRTVRQPNWLYAFSWHQRWMRRLLNATSAKLDKLGSFVSQQGLVKDAVYWIGGHYQVILTIAASALLLKAQLPAQPTKVDSPIVSIAAAAAPKEHLPTDTSFRSVWRSSESVGEIKRIITSNNGDALALVAATAVSIFATRERAAICSLPEDQYTSAAFLQNDAALATTTQLGTLSVWSTTDCRRRRPSHVSPLPSAPQSRHGDHCNALFARHRRYHKRTGRDRSDDHDQLRACAGR